MKKILTEKSVKRNDDDDDFKPVFSLPHAVSVSVFTYIFFSAFLFFEN